MTELSCIGFADEMRVGLRGMTRRWWGKRGVKIYQPVQLKYDWCYLFLLVEPVGGKLHWCWLDSMKPPELLAAVGAVARDQLVDAVVWDGAGSHKAGSVTALTLPLVSLPPYSPELNPAERFFGELRAAVEGKVYANLEDKIAAVEAELRAWDADPTRVRSLTYYPSIRNAFANLPTLDFNPSQFAA